jgi:monofunctional biosynthetic peptidoglycan transglycosylase
MILILFNGLLNEVNMQVLLNADIMKTDKKWRVVNDGVMGGISTSGVKVSDEGTVLFSGSVSLENNGGFASLRSQTDDYDFTGYEGFEIRIKGDGKIYGVSMKETSYFTGYFYSVTFETVKDEWAVIRLPFSTFYHKYFGRDINASPVIPLDKIKEVSFIISDKQEGIFSAEIDYIRLY